MVEESVESRRNWAISSTSPAELEKLAEDENKDVRWAVARKNANTPVPLLEKLAGDEDYGVRQAVAYNRII